jgi:helitron helicase-like protein
VCTGVLEALTKPAGGEIGILGEVSTYFGAVETNSRGMLHLHCLVWLAGNLDFFDLRSKMLNDPEFANQMIDYLDSVIFERIDPDPCSLVQTLSETSLTGRLVAKLKILQGERAQSNLGSEREGVERSKGEEGRIREALNLSST